MINESSFRQFVHRKVIGRPDMIIGPRNVDFVLLLLLLLSRQPGDES